MTRDQASTMTSLNGLWEFQLSSGHTTSPTGEGVFDDRVPFGVTLNQTILVPFPLEACLSGAFAWPLYSKFMFYRLLFDAPAASAQGLATLLHFGAVDWNTTVYLNGQMVGQHLGGYDGFSFDISKYLLAHNNELILAVFDPSDEGYQLNGKQRISAISHPGGDTYTPSSGVWQTVWLETVQPYHIADLKVRGDTEHLYLVVKTSMNVPGLVTGTVSFGGKEICGFSGDTFSDIVVAIPPPVQLWHPSHPHLYDLTITVVEPSTAATDSVGSYFGMREVGLLSFNRPSAAGPGVLRPAINGEFVFLTGFLDQSWWPDGEYTAPTDEALKFDLQIVKDLGMNVIRLHQARTRNCSTAVRAFGQSVHGCGVRTARRAVGAGCRLAAAPCTRQLRLLVVVGYSGALAFLC